MNKITPGNKINKVGIAKIIIIVILFAMLMLFLVYKNFTRLYISDRPDKCLLVFKNKGYDVKFNKLPLQFYNPFYKKQRYYKLCDYYIASSFKSYLPCGHTYDFNSYNAIKDVIHKGARWIHLDIYAKSEGILALDKNAIPVVTNGHDDGTMMYYPTAKPLVLEKCFDIIAQQGWLNNNYPLLLYLNLNVHNNEHVLKKVASAIVDKFGNRLLDKRYSFMRENIGQIHVNELLNKIIIITNQYPTSSGYMNEMINSTVSSDTNKNEQQIKKIIFNDDNISYGGIIATVHDTDEFINYNKFHMTTVMREEDFSLTNVVDPKSDVSNYDFESCMKLGVQICCMSYQLYDDDMKKYIEFFKNCSFVVKPKELRYIDKPDFVPRAQQKQLYYQKRRVKNYCNDEGVCFQDIGY